MYEVLDSHKCVVGRSKRLRYAGQKARELAMTASPTFVFEGNQLIVAYSRDEQDINRLRSEGLDVGVLIR